MEKRLVYLIFITALISISTNISIQLAVYLYLSISHKVQYCTYIPDNENANRTMYPSVLIIIFLSYGFKCTNNLWLFVYIIITIIIVNSRDYVVVILYYCFLAWRDIWLRNYILSGKIYIMIDDKQHDCSNGSQTCNHKRNVNREKSLWLCKLPLIFRNII